jgi:diguanylate cyclase (GGDEF)-like protein/PAS domain S-box-containing protein
MQLAPNMKSEGSRFSVLLWLTVFLLGLSAASFAIYTWSEKQIDSAYDSRHESFLLADELRQSSDDLTRMARTYVITGEARYKLAYQAILDIRDGTRPKPQGYQNVYWDVALLRERGVAIDSSNAVPLLTLMQQAGFTPQELDLLAQAKAQSDALTATETAAMKLMETGDLQAKARAQSMLHDDAYHTAKAIIMEPIKEFYVQQDQRTRMAVESAQTRALWLRLTFMVFAFSLILLLQRARTVLNSTLGGSVKDVFEHIARIGKGDLDTPIVVNTHDQTSVLAWLAQTQSSLKNIELERQQAHNERIESEAHLRAIIEAEPECIKIVDAQGSLLQMNPAGLAMIEADSMAQVAGQPVIELLAPEYRDAFQKLHQQVIAGESLHLEFEILGLKGGRRWLETHAVPMQDRGQTVHLAVTRDITERKQAEVAQRVAAEAFDTLAFFDPLTHLPNRRLLMDRLEQALTASTRHARKAALMFVDLDNFKTLNDTLGHSQGDVLLEQVAQRLKTCIREGDTVAHLGSDEFVVMLEDLSEHEHDAADQAECVGDKILTVFHEDFMLPNGAYHCTASIGVTLFGGGHQEGTQEPLKRAELAMFQVKASGHNALRFFDARIQAEVSARASLEADLREAVHKQQFLLNYQPQVVGDGRITGVEALVRWQHPQRGLVPPSEFITLAESNDLILPIGQWVLDTACAQLVAWSIQPDLAHLTMSVNVSARQFKQADFVKCVLATLKRSGANPKRLKLELTESMLLDDVESITTKMGELKAHGVGFSLDDFGTGYSSLTYLKRLPLNQLKIDQSFVKNIVTDPNDAAIARMVVVLAESMGLSVIAEGVELQAQADLLAHLGCHAYQGYLFSRPLPIKAFEAYARKRSSAAQGLEQI